MLNCSMRRNIRFLTCYQHSKSLSLDPSSGIG